MMPMIRLSFLTAMTLVMLAPAQAQEPPDPPVVSVNADQWLVFYDVPSRRFRDIRINFFSRRV